MICTTTVESTVMRNKTRRVQLKANRNSQSNKLELNKVIERLSSKNKNTRTQTGLFHHGTHESSLSSRKAK
jgi:hypothetical protein